MAKKYVVGVSCQNVRLDTQNIFILFFFKLTSYNYIFLHEKIKLDFGQNS